MKKKLIASHEFFYGGKTQKAGEEFEAVDPDATILVCLGKATEAAVKSVAPPPPAPKIETAELSAEKPSQKEEAPTERRRRYARRDMVAED